MNTKYHIDVDLQSGSSTIVWEKVAGNDYKAHGNSRGAFLTTHFDAYCSTPVLIVFDLNVMSDAPYLYIITTEDMNLESDAVLILYFTDGTKYQMRCSEVWDGYTAVFPLDKAILDILSEKEIDKYTFQGVQNSFTGDMSCKANHLSRYINRYDKGKGAKLFKEYVSDFKVILVDDLCIDVSSSEANVEDGASVEEEWEDRMHFFSFMDIPLTSSLDYMVDKLELKGFKHQFTKNNRAIMTGAFAFEDNCMLMITESDDPTMGCSITIGGDVRSSWLDLKSKYDDYKVILTNKYGTPKSIESFFEPYFDGCGEEILALQTGQGVMSSIFTVNNVGEIRLLVLSDRIALMYRILQEDDIEDQDSRRNKAFNDL